MSAQTYYDWRARAEEAEEENERLLKLIKSIRDISTGAVQVAVDDTEALGIIQKKIDEAMK